MEDCLFLYHEMINDDVINSFSIFYADIEEGKSYFGFLRNLNFRGSYVENDLVNLVIHISFFSTLKSLSNKTIFGAVPL